MIYLDHNATTEIAPEVVDAISNAHRTAWGNPSSSHSLGRAARAALETARVQLADALGIKQLTNPATLIFTSGGTESLNWVIRSTLEPGSHCVTTGVEHCAVNGCLGALGGGGVELSTVSPPPGEFHLVPETVVESVRPNTKLVCVQLANNETGAIHPVSEIGRLLSQLDKPPLLLVDASQSLGKMAIDVESLNADFLVVAGHKFYGPRTGALWIKNPENLKPLFIGGGQEYGMRAGTENVADAVGLATAAGLVTADLSLEISRLRETRDHLQAGIMKLAPDSTWLSAEPCLPNTLLVSIPQVSDKLQKLREKVFFSTGAACHSGASSSSVLSASKIDPDLQRNMLRFSTGRNTTTKDIEQTLDHLENLL